MTAPAATARILVVANQTASTPHLLREVTQSAKGGAEFTLLIPPECAQHRGSDWTREDAVRMLTQAAGSEVGVLDCGADALDTIHGAVDAGQFDEIIVCTVPEHLARWVHHDLAHRVEHLGLPVRVIPPSDDEPIPDDVKNNLPSGFTHLPVPSAGGAGSW